MTEKIPYWTGKNMKRKNKRINIIVGARGDGKTYCMKKLALRRYELKRHETMWLRVSTEELKANNYAVISTWLDDLPQKARDTYIVDVKYRCIRQRKTGDVVVRFATLSQVNQIKSVSYPRVWNIVLDEAVSQVGDRESRLGSKNPERLANIFSTVFRHRENGIKVYILSNNVNGFNPYVEYLKLEKSERKQKEVYVEYIADTEFKKFMSDSFTGLLFENTNYYGFAIENESLLQSAYKKANKTYKYPSSDALITIACFDTKYTLYVTNKALIVSHKHTQNLNTCSLDGTQYRRITSREKSKVVSVLERALSMNAFYYHDVGDVAFMLELVKELL